MLWVPSSWCQQPTGLSSPASRGVRTRSNECLLDNDSLRFCNLLSGVGSLLAGAGARMKLSLWCRQDTCSSLPSLPLRPRSASCLRRAPVCSPMPGSSPFPERGPSTAPPGGSVQQRAGFHPGREGRGSLSVTRGLSVSPPGPWCYRKACAPQTLDSSDSPLGRHTAKGPQGGEKIWVLFQCHHFLAVRPKGCELQFAHL